MLFSQVSNGKTASLTTIVFPAIDNYRLNHSVWAEGGESIKWHVTPLIVTGAKSDKIHPSANYFAILNWIARGVCVINT